VREKKEKKLKRERPQQAVACSILQSVTQRLRRVVPRKGEAHFPEKVTEEKKKKAALSKGHHQSMLELIPIKRDTPR